MIDDPPAISQGPPSEHVLSCSATASWQSSDGSKHCVLICWVGLTSDGTIEQVRDL